MDRFAENSSLLHLHSHSLYEFFTLFIVMFRVALKIIFFNPALIIRDTCPPENVYKSYNRIQLYPVLEPYQFGVLINIFLFVSLIFVPFIY